MKRKSSQDFIDSQMTRNVEVLSQDEIEQLLKAINAGESGNDVGPSTAPSPARSSTSKSVARQVRQTFQIGSYKSSPDSKIRIYDFKRPDIATTSDIRKWSQKLDKPFNLQNFIEEVTEQHLSAVRLADVDTSTLEEYDRALPTPALLGYASTDKPEEYALFYLSIDAAQYIMLRAVDGSDSLFSPKSHRVSYSSTEHVIARAIADAMRLDLEASSTTPVSLTLRECVLGANIARGQPEFASRSSMGVVVCLEVAFPHATDESLQTDALAYYFVSRALFDRMRASSSSSSERSLPKDLSVQISIRSTPLMMKLRDLKNLHPSKLLTVPTVIEGVDGDTLLFTARWASLSSRTIQVVSTTNLRRRYSQVDKTTIAQSIKDIDVTLSVELGRKTVKLRDLQGIQEGALIELDSVSGEPVKVYANNALIAKGEVCVTSDDMMTIRVIEVEDNCELDD